MHNFDAEAGVFRPHFEKPLVELHNIVQSLMVQQTPAGTTKLYAH
jgi:hypothetical protein